jgi:hypothetical protein
MRFVPHRHPTITARYRVILKKLRESLGVELNIAVRGDQKKINKDKNKSVPIYREKNVFSRCTDADNQFLPEFIKEESVVSYAIL